LVSVHHELAVKKIMKDATERCELVFFYLLYFRLISTLYNRVIEQEEATVRYALPAVSGIVRKKERGRGRQRGRGKGKG
jgi:hypothetical protein